MRFLKLVIVVVAAIPAERTYAQELDKPDAEESPAEAYASKGTLEIGGEISATVTSDIKTVDLGPNVGYFVADRIELTLELDFLYARIEDDMGNGVSRKSGALLIEPSYHHPISDELLVNGELGLGVGYDGTDWDGEIIPHVGLDIVTRRGNVVEPAVELPIRIGEAFGDTGDVGVSVGLGVTVEVSGTW